MTHTPGAAAEEGGSASARQGFALTLTLFGTLLAVTLCAQLPAGLWTSWLGDRRTTYAEVWPQGWAFFAALPDAELISADRLGPGGRLSTPLLAPQMSAANLWGLARTSTVDFEQAVALAGEVPVGDWTHCADIRSASCLAGARVVPLRNAFSPGIVCGELVLVRAPSAETGTESASASVALVRVACR